MQQTTLTGKFKFIAGDDDLARLINEKANLLIEQLNGFDINTTGVDEFGKY